MCQTSQLVSYPARSHERAAPIFGRDLSGADDFHGAPNRDLSPRHQSIRRRDSLYQDQQTGKHAYHYSAHATHGCRDHRDQLQPARTQTHAPQTNAERGGNTDGPHHAFGAHSRRPEPRGRSSSSIPASCVRSKRPVMSMRCTFRRAVSGNFSPSGIWKRSALIKGDLAPLESRWVK